MAAGQDTQRQKQHLQHVVAVPLPEQGHLNALMRFCKLLAKHPGFILTFVDSDPFPPRLQQLQHRHDHTPQAADDGAAPLIRRTGLDSINASIPDSAGSAMPSSGHSIEQLITSLNRNGPPVTCLLSDLIVSDVTLDVADKLGIPCVVLVPLSASMVLFNHYLMHSEHGISIQRVMEASATAATKRGEVFAHGLPGLPTLFYEDVPRFRHMTDDNQLCVWEGVRAQWKSCVARAHSLVVNSFMDLEEPTFRALWEACTTTPIYDVGLWAEPLSNDDATSLWKEDTSCMAWLDRQRTASVLYIPFGSVDGLSSSQLEEFEDGLISSEQHFLWVLRPGLVPDQLDGSSYGASVMSKSHGRGLVISWAPQSQVLAHPSVGGFLTHCGWNSITESIINGVPMLCWPFVIDQPLNARCIMDEWKVGLGFKAGSKEGRGVVSERDEVEKAIRTLMEGEVGRVLRQNAANLKEKSKQSFSESGSATAKLKALIQSINNRKV